MRIVGYSYRADVFCLPCIADIAITRVHELGSMTPWDHANDHEELILDEWAILAGIVDREDEATFDSGDFPKVILSLSVEEDERCAKCGSFIK